MSTPEVQQAQTVDQENEVIRQQAEADLPDTGEEVQQDDIPVEVSERKAEAGKPPEYTPNYKYTVIDEEKEIDELFRGLIKDPESERIVRELHEKAYGLDAHKKNHERLREKYSALEGTYHDVSGRYGAIEQDLKRLSKYVQQNDFDGFFKELNIPQDSIFGWVQQKLAELELPAEQRQILERTRQAAHENNYLQERIASLEANAESREVQARTFQLDQALTRPGVAEVAKEFEARVGKPGAFREEVIREGIVHWNATQRDISAEEAIQHVMDRVGKIISVAPQAGGAAGSRVQEGSGGQKVVMPKPTIPAMRSGGASPITSSPRSTDDLRKLADSMR